MLSIEHNNEPHKQRPIRVTFSCNLSRNNVETRKMDFSVCRQLWTKKKTEPQRGIEFMSSRTPVSALTTELLGNSWRASSRSHLLRSYLLGLLRTQSHLCARRFVVREGCNTSNKQSQLVVQHLLHDKLHENVPHITWASLYKYNFCSTIFSLLFKALAT